MSETLSNEGLGYVRHEIMYVVALQKSILDDARSILSLDSKDYLKDCVSRLQKLAKVIDEQKKVHHDA